MGEVLFDRPISILDRSNFGARCNPRELQHERNKRS